MQVIRGTENIIDWYIFSVPPAVSDIGMCIPTDDCESMKSEFIYS